jgi:2'-5' RNA ligase
MRLRLFAAIALPDEVVSRLVPLQRDVTGAAWLPAENFHLTLRFFGELDGALARDLDEELGQISAAPFEVRVSGVGAFGPREVTVLWAGIEPKEPVVQLAGGCDRAARRLKMAPVARKFSPHVTLAYCKGVHEVEAASFLQRNAELKTETFFIDRFALYSSHQTKSGRRYMEEAVYPLLG